MARLWCDLIGHVFTGHCSWSPPASTTTDHYLAPVEDRSRKPTTNLSITFAIVPFDADGKKASVGKSVQAKKSTVRDTVTHKTEPCLSDALADAFSGRSSGDKIRSPGAVFCACTWYTHTCSAMLGLDFVCPSCYRFLMKREERKRHRWRQLFLFLLPQLGTIHKNGESLRHSMCYTWGTSIVLLPSCIPLSVRPCWL